MSTITFDTLQHVDKLKAAGFQQAEAIIRVLAEAQDTLVTKDYFDHKLEKEFGPIKTDQAVQKWMIGVLLAGVLSLVLKVFF